MRAHKVAIVLVPEFGSGQLRSLAKRMHVWIAATNANRPAIEAIWAQNAGYSAASGVTGIDPSDRESPSEFFERVLEAVEEHHGIHSHDPPWTVLHVYGVSATRSVREALAEYGAMVLHERQDHFTAHRPDPSPHD
jgi:hypothetical protein